MWQVCKNQGGTIFDNDCSTLPLFSSDTEGSRVAPCQSLKRPFVNQYSTEGVKNPADFAAAAIWGEERVEEETLI